MIDYTKLDPKWFGQSTWASDQGKSSPWQTTGQTGGQYMSDAKTNPYNQGYSGQNQTTADRTSTTDPAYDKYYNYEFSPEWKSQYGNGVYNIYEDRWSTGDEANKIKQNWWSSPDWNTIGNSEATVYNPEYGWQPYEDVANFYRNYYDATGAAPNWDQLTSSNPWQANMAFPGYGGDGGGGGGGDVNSYAWGSGYDNPQYQTYQDYSGDPYGGMNTMWTPPEWDTAGNMFSSWATNPEAGLAGNPSLGYGVNSYANMIDNQGQSTNWAPQYEAAKKAAQYDVNTEIDNAAEKAGLGGMRWSTPLGRTAQDIAGKYSSQLGSQFATNQMNAEEAARARQLQATAGLTGIGQGLNANQMSGAQQLAGLGTTKSQYPLQVAQQSWNMGQDQYKNAASADQQTYQDYLRSMAEENNPWLSQIYSMANQSGVPKTYTPGGCTQFLNGIGG